jgi:nucleoside-diphosphate-sugar epimerase
VNLATGILTSVRAFAECAARVLGLPAELLRFGALPERPGELTHDPPALDRLLELTGWRPPTGIEAGVRRTVAAGYLAAAPQGAPPLPFQP